MAEEERVYEKTIKYIEDYAKYFSSLLDKKFSNDSVLYAKQRKQLVEISNKDMSATNTVEVPVSALDNVLAELNNQGIVAAPLQSNNKTSESMGYYLVWFDARNSDNNVVVKNVLQQVSQSSKTKIDISPESMPKILEELKSHGIKIAWEKNNDTGTYSICVNSKYAELLDKACLKHERVTRSIAPPLDSVIINHLKDNGILFESEYDNDTQMSKISYAKSDSLIVTNLISSYREAGILSMDDFCNKYENSRCLEYTFKDEVELNRFIDTISKSPIDYAIDKNTIVFKAEDIDPINSAISNSMTKLYSAGKYNKYLDAVADAKIQEESINLLYKNKNGHLYFASSENPNIYAELKNGNLMVYQVISNTTGKKIHAEYRTCFALNDKAKIGSCLAALGTPILIPNDKFNAQNFEEEKLFYKNIIEKTFKDKLNENNLHYHEDNILSGIDISKSPEEIYADIQNSTKPQNQKENISVQDIKEELNVMSKNTTNTEIKTQFKIREIHRDLDSIIKGYGMEDLSREESLGIKKETNITEKSI